MSGRIITISPRQTYTVAVTASGNPVQVPIGQRVYNSIEVVSGTLSVWARVGGSFLPGARVEVFVRNTLSHQRGAERDLRTACPRVCAGPRHDPCDGRDR